MSLPRAFIKLSVVLTLASVTLFTASASGQTPATRPNSTDKRIDAAQGAPLENPENKVAAEETKPADLKSEIAGVKAENAAIREENAAVREQLRKMEEQQKILLELVGGLQRQLNGRASAEVSGAEQPPGPATGAEASTPSPPAPLAKAKQTDDDRYRDGIIIWQTPDTAKVPFLMRFNVNSQIRFLNTLSSDETFTDHLGVVREVQKRNDITVNRTMFIMGGYIFDKRLRYSSTVWTSAGAASIVVAGNIGWQFNKALTITGGYNGVPGSRSLVNTFPFFTSTDRSMADNFFRPGFTQGVWANGEPVKGLNYMVFVGNGLNTINISANKIDTHLLLSGSVWWEPLGDYGEPGKSRNMYDDYFASKKTRIRLGASFTRSREDRFSNLDVSSPENTSLYNSDGVLTFATGAFAPGVTLNEATYRMSAIDGGIKRNGLAINGQYFFRWLNDFKADGPLPLTSTFDHGFELSASYFVVPRKLVVYARGSKVFGQFRNPDEYAAGLKWHFLPTERLWLNAELMRVNGSPYTGAFTPYNAGINGWAPMLQTVLAF